jgi:5-methyltetrahydropteroyltriglutamate--homocysteine methyltransferase
MADHTSPTARAEVVGSLLQPEELLTARAGVREGTTTPEALHALEDAAVIASIALQESVGLDVITDGEVRRASWSDTVNHLNNIVTKQVPRSYPANPAMMAASAERPTGGPVPLGGHGAQGGANNGFPTVSGRITPKAEVTVGAEYPFLQAHANTRTKYTMAAPSYHRRYWSDAAAAESGYDSCEEFLSDVRDWLKGVAAWLVTQGCTYIQLDAPNYGSLCDEKNVAWHKEQGHDVDRELAFDAALDSSVCDGLPVTSALHICRGNMPGGTWHSGGGYGAIAEQMFPHLDFDVALLEYDSDRAGDFGPIELIKPGTVAVLGLLTTKAAPLEDEGDLEARIGEATKFRPLEDLALSTQCGFASAANAPMTVDEQRAKLQRVATVAHRVWA